jgi:peptidoglycan hydrolase-like protein with peptidoglycan-binding domain
MTGKPTKVARRLRNMKPIGLREIWLQKEAETMGKPILTAIILSAGITLASQPIFAQAVPETGQRGGSSSEKGGGTSSQKMDAPAKPDRTGTSDISSDDIMKVKVALKAKGVDPGPITGTMDSKTEQALREFQKANNLPVTGKVDQQTAAKLGVTLSSAGGASGRGSAREPAGNVSESTKQDSPARPSSPAKPEGQSRQEKQ